MADLSNCGSLALEHMLLITMSCCFHWLSQVWGVPISSILSHCLHEPIKCLKNPRSYLKFIFYMPVVGNLHLDFSHLSIILAPDFIVTIYFTCEVKALLGLPASIFQDCVGQQICEKCVEDGLKDSGIPSLLPLRLSIDLVARYFFLLPSCPTLLLDGSFYCCHPVSSDMKTFMIITALSGNSSSKGMTLLPENRSLPPDKNLFWGSIW